MKDRKIVYIAGPVTGVEHYAVMFFIAANEVEAEGNLPINPASLLQKDMPYETAMHICLSMVEMADEIELLPGWRNSPGVWREIRHLVKECGWSQSKFEVVPTKGGRVKKED